MRDLGLLRHAILAALGVAGCSSSSQNGAIDVDVPPPGAATTPVGSSSRPPRAEQGYVLNANGNVHRASAVACDATIEQPACRGDEGHKQCSADADCKEGPHGKCVSGSGQIGSYCGCEYACESDAECKTGEACVCKEHAGLGHSTCAPATCKADADCASGACGVSSFNNGCGTAVSLTCRSPSDTCTSDADCASAGMPGGACRVSAGDARGKPTAWSCQHVSCAIGRPLLIDDVARTASIAVRRDWSDDALAAALEGSAAALAAPTRSAVARHFAQMAGLEHASVASFARASLELLALGAPPDLLRDTHAAAIDEVRHARLAWAVARAHGAGDVGPGRLDLAGALALTADPARVARAVAFEGCVGETLGAAEARAAEGACDDPALASALGQIADDEQAHATLAWRTLAWLVTTFGDDARRAAREGIDAGLAALVGEVGEVGEAPGVPARGLLDGAAITALRRAVARDVVTPCAAAALA